MDRVSDSYTSSSDLPSHGTRRGGTWILLGCVFVLCMGFGVLQKTRTALVREAFRDGAAATCRTLLDRVDSWRGRARAPGELPGVVFGDSVFLSLRDPKKAFAPALERSLAAPGRSVALLDLTHLGLSAFQFYYLTDGVVAGQPRFAIVEVNLRTFATDWQEIEWLRFSQLAGGLSLRQAWRMRNELATQNMSPLDPLVYRLQQRTGTLFLFDGLRRLGREALETAGGTLNGALGLTTRPPAEKATRILQQNLVLDGDHARAWYGGDFAETPPAAVLRAVRRALRNGGVKTFFVVAPFNREWLAHLGLSLVEITDRTEKLRRVIGSPRPSWIDLSGTYRPSDFIDAIHLTPDGVERLATSVGQHVAEQLREDGADREAEERPDNSLDGAVVRSSLRREPRTEQTAPSGATGSRHS